MNIFIVPSWYPSKLSPENGTFFRDQAQILAKYGDDVTVIVDLVHSFKNLLRIRRFSTVKFQPENLGGVIEYRQETLNWFPKRPQKTYFSQRRRLIKLLERAIAERGRPDLVIAHSSLFAGAELARWLKDNDIPMIVTEHLMHFLKPEMLTEFYKDCIHEAYCYADRIVATSSRLRDSIAVQFPEFPTKIVVVPNPVDISAFSPASEGKKALKPFVFLCVALLRPEKRLDLLLRAFATVRQNNPDTQLVLVGDGPQRLNIEHLISNLNLQSSVTLTGYLPQTEIAGWMQKCHTLILPSEVETFGLVLVEAMACGLPVIATRCGGPEDIVTPETGFLVPVNDVTGLTEAMQKMIIEYCQFDPQSIRQTVIDKFSDHKYYWAIHNLYDEIMNNSPKLK